MAEKEEKHIVFKIEDFKDVMDLHPNLKPAILEAQRLYDKYREFRGKKQASYVVCNQDEPYAEEVWRIILEGEDVKAGISPKEKKIPIADLIIAGMELLKAGKESLGYREALAEIYAQVGPQAPDGVDSYLWQRVAGLVGGEG